MFTESISAGLTQIRVQSSEQSFMPERPPAQEAWGTWGVCSQSAV